MKSVVKQFGDPDVWPGQSDVRLFVRTFWSKMNASLFEPGDVTPVKSRPVVKSRVPLWVASEVISGVLSARLPTGLPDTVTTTAPTATETFVYFETSTPANVACTHWLLNCVTVLANLVKLS